jgi:hypothetical protein
LSKWQPPHDRGVPRNSPFVGTGGGGGEKQVEGNKSGLPPTFFLSPIALRSKGKKKLFYMKERGTNALRTVPGQCKETRTTQTDKEKPGVRVWCTIVPPRMCLPLIIDGRGSIVDGSPDNSSNNNNRKAKNATGVYEV